MKTPHVQTRLYPDKTFSIDFYENYKRKNYINLFLEGITSIKRKLEIEMGNLVLRPTPFYFTQCFKCRIYILTNRDLGYKLDCLNCNYRNSTNVVHNYKLDELLDNIHNSLGKSVVNLNGQILFLLVQPSDDEKIDSITQICKDSEFEKVDEKEFASSMLQYEGHQRGMLKGDKKTFIFKKKCDKDVFGYLNETPPLIDKLVREIRMIDPEVITLSINFEQEENSVLALIAQGRLNEARKLLETELVADPSNTANLVLLSEVLVNMGRLEEARRKIFLARNMDPNNVFVLSQLGRIQSRLGNYDEAREILEHVVEINPLDKTTLGELFLCYRKMGRLDLAAGIATRLNSLGGL
jgi:hypothetical protein